MAPAEAHWLKIIHKPRDGIEEIIQPFCLERCPMPTFMPDGIRPAPQYAITKVDIIINATSMGMVGQPDFSQPISRAKKTALVVDIVYNPLITGLIKEAKKLKLKTVGGIGMLINQAVPGFEHWFQKKPQVDEEIRRFIIG